MKTKRFILAGLLATGIFSCKKDPLPPQNPPVVNEGELITTVKLSFTDTTGVQPDVTAIFRDTDGEGGAAPTSFDTIKLAAATVYRCTVLLLNEATNPVDTLSNEILAEANEHLFCYGVSGGADVSIAITDTDGILPLGLVSRWNIGTATQGSVTVTLKHQPDGLKDGTCSPGDTDVELDFRIEIQ
jgi:hypothetical protein